jgi:hypothetical protein
MTIIALLALEALIWFAKWFIVANIVMLAIKWVKWVWES